MLDYEIDFWGKLRRGIEAAIILKLAEAFEKKKHYTEIEFSWVGDFNPKMKATLEALGANPGKIHITYRKMFDDNKAFKKAESIPERKKAD